MKKPTKFISWLTVLTVLTGFTSPSTHAASFPDIKSPVLLEAVIYLNEKGIIKGYADGTFKPNQVINRAEALKIIFESRGIAVESDTNSGFPDVDANLWFAIYVTSAKKLGLIQGYADGTYKPTQQVNKAEFLKIAMLAQQYYENPADLSVATRQYSDLSSNEWYVPYVAFALENNFLDKVGKLSPTAGITRGEAALIIYRVAKHNETLSAEPAPYLSCETCVNGEDIIEKFPFLENNPLVEITDGKLIIGGEDVTRFTFDEKSMRMEISAAENRHTIENTPYEEKIHFEIKYPEYYQRLLDISGGQQSGDSYLEGNGHIYLFQGNKKFENCDCQFELNIINLYNDKGYTESFHKWITTDKAKEKIFNYIIYDLNKIE